MNSKPLFALAAILAFEMAQGQSTVKEYAVAAQTVAMKAVVQHCAAATPDHADELHKEFRHYELHAADAVQRVFDRSGMDPAGTVPQRMKDLVDEVTKAQLAKAQSLPADAYCPRLLASLKGSTAETIQRRIEAGMQLARAAQGASGAGSAARLSR